MLKSFWWPDAHWSKNILVTLNRDDFFLHKQITSTISLTEFTRVGKSSNCYEIFSTFCHYAITLGIIFHGSAKYTESTSSLAFVITVWQILTIFGYFCSLHQEFCLESTFFILYTYTWDFLWSIINIQVLTVSLAGNNSFLILKKSFPYVRRPFTKRFCNKEREG